MENRFGKRLRNDREDGVVTVIVAFLLVALFGFASFAIDESCWLVKQRQFQNAADAAALAACETRYKTHIRADGTRGQSTEQEARESAFMLANQNNVDATEDEMKLYFDDSHKSVKAVISKKTDNYFSQAVTGKNRQTVTVTATAALTTRTETSSNRHRMGSAVESRQNIEIQQSASQNGIQGGVNCTGSLKISSPLTIRNGIRANGNIDVWNTLNVTDGDLSSGGNVSCTSPVNIQNGDVRLDGSFSDSADHSQYRNVYAGSISSSNALNVSGEQVRRTPDDPPYVWNWGWLKEEIQTNIDNGVYVEVTADMVNAYHEKKEREGQRLDESSLKISGDTLIFDGPVDVGEFFKFCREYANKRDGVIYVRYRCHNTSNVNFNYDGSLIFQHDFWPENWRNVTIHGSVVSMEGSIRINSNSGSQQSTIDGALVTLGTTSSDSGIWLDHQTNVNDGAVISAGDIYCSDSFNITSDSAWIDIVDPPQTVTKEYVGLTQ